MFELRQSFLSKYRNLNPANYKLSKEGKVIDKKINELYSRRILLPSGKIRLLAILLQYTDLSVFTDEELNSVGQLDLQHLLNDSNEIMEVDLSLSNHIFYEDKALSFITNKELKEKLGIDSSHIKGEYCKQKTSIDNFIVRLS